MKRISKTDAIALFVLAFALFLLCQDLSLRPFHHDEGVNGFFLTRLVREGAYKYDPGNYHGPTLYYFSLPLVAILGLSDAAVRGTTVLFGLLTLVVLWRLLARSSAAMALAATALYATSTGAVFFSRYFIHETLFVAFTLCVVFTSPTASSRERWRFVTTGLALGLLFATKETAFVSAGALAAGALVAAWLVERISPLAVARGIKPFAVEHAESLMHGALAFVASAGLLYSSFFRNPVGILDAFRTFAFWTKTAVRDHENPWYQHLSWLREADPVLIYLGFAGILVALALRRSFIAVMASVWGLVLFAAYAVVRYKTPWLGLNMLPPLAITAGYLLAEIARVSFLKGRLSLRPVAMVLTLAATGFSATKTWDLETKNYDDESHPYLYAHTQRSLIPFVHLIEERAAAIGSGRDAGIAVFAPENWPLPWYLRDYKNAGYWGEFKTDVNVDLYVGSVEQDPQLALKLGEKYERFGPYNMRGVVNLVLYAKKVHP